MKRIDASVLSLKMTNSKYNSLMLGCKDSTVKVLRIDEQGLQLLNQFSFVTEQPVHSLVLHQ